MPVNVRRSTVLPDWLEEEYDRPAPAPDPGGTWQGIVDTYATKFWGAAKDRAEETLVRNRYRRTDFDGLDNVPEGYEGDWEAFMWARSPEEVEAIAANLDDMRERRARLNQHSFGANVFYGLVAGVADPVNLIGGPTLKGIGFIRAALLGGASYGSINAVQEVGHNVLDTTVTDEETAINIGFGYAFAGLISGASGRFGSRSGTAALPREVRAKAEAQGDAYGKVHAAVEGKPVTEAIDFDGQLVRIVDGPTGKKDANGNAVRAFYRPKEAVEEMRRREAQAKAVDDTLGPVIPEEAAPVRLVNDAVDAADETVVPLRDEIDDDLPPWTIDEMDELAEATPIRSADEAGDAAEDAALPFGGMGDEAAPPRADDGVEDTIYIDSAALREDFENKPWTAPRYPGIEPLAEDAFATPQEWVNFVTLHELHHHNTRKLPGEGTAAYENRINRLAYEEMKAGRLPLSPTDSALEKLMLLPTPSGTLMRLAPRHDPTHSLVQSVAGDHSTMNIANLAGRPTTPGGSVFQKAHRWLYAHYVTTMAWRRAYAEYVRGSVSESNTVATFEAMASGVPFVGSAAKQGKARPHEFRQWFGRAINSDKPFPSTLDEAQTAALRARASEVRKVLKTFERAAREQGMFDAQRGLKRDIDWRTRANERDAATLESLGKKKPGLRAHIERRIAERTAELDELAAELEEVSAREVLPSGEEHYWPRIFDIGAIRKRTDAFIALLEHAYARDGNVNARQAAEETTARILGRGVDETTFGTGSGRHMRHRQIPLTNDELADFIVWDVDVVMGIYTRRMGAAIEMNRMHGSTLLDEQLDALETRLVADGFDPKKRTAILHEIEDMRDRVLGRFHASDPLNWQNRTARAIKNFGSLTLMGRGIYAQLVDVARTLAVEGHGPLFRAMGAMLDNRRTGATRGQYARQAGEALELVNVRWQAMVMENDSALMVTQQSGIERGLAAAQAPFFTLNLMNPFTVMWKDFTSLMSAHTLIAQSRRVAKAVGEGRTIETMTRAEQKELARLASFGIDLRMAQAIAKQPFETTDGSGLHLANLEAWTGREGEMAREAFMGALSGKLRSNVVTPGPMQRAAIMDGVFRVKGKRMELPILSLPFQLMSFTMSSSAKITHAMLSGRDPHRGVTLASLLVGGYLSAWLAAGDRWENMDWKERAFSALDRSGALGFIPDIGRRLDSFELGPRAALGLDTYSSTADQVGAIAGPAPGVIAGAIEAFIDDDIEGNQQAAKLRRVVPFAGLVWFDESVKDLSNAIVGWTDDGGIDLPEQEAMP